MKSSTTNMNLKHQPPSWIIAEHVALGLIKTKIMKWTHNRAKVILNTAEIPKQALPAISSGSTTSFGANKVVATL